ncbi:MAG: Gfo/Idh/MocA family oxidoreductase [Magnetococcales bacterium]|nr:Gfo/Idh/MocA family oxidoreductase [Magnetococcales bacterium]
MKRRLAILGISGIAERHAASLRALPDATLVAAWGRDPARCAAFVQRHAIPRCAASAQEILTDPAVDGVLILTEPARHLELAHAALECGKPMLIEKPLGLDPTACRDFAARARGSDLPIGVVAPYRFDPRLETLRRQIAQLDSASPRLVQLTLNWPRNAAYYQHGSGWRRHDGGVMINQGIHWLDTLNWFFGLPQRIEAHSLASRAFLACADTTAALLIYPANVLVLIAANTFQHQERQERLVIQHAQGTLEYTHPLPDGCEPMQRQLTDFLAAIRDHRPPRVTPEHGLHALEVAWACGRLLEMD